MKNRLSITLRQKNLLTEKNTMSWENILASLTCGKANMPPRSLVVAAGAIIYFARFCSEDFFCCFYFSGHTWNAMRTHVIFRFCGTVRYVMTDCFYNFPSRRLSLDSSVFCYVFSRRVLVVEKFKSIFIYLILLNWKFLY